MSSFFSCQKRWTTYRILPSSPRLIILNQQLSSEGESITDNMGEVSRLLSSRADCLRRTSSVGGADDVKSLSARRDSSAE